ncbi:MAG: hypothetical protein IKM43_02420 [Clostridia bacterium]|nr:hypothetical protein [Clostridia bacterium]
MVKKVFKIIGIVVGSVSLFVGAVFGVLALMGKFKTPIVYPEALSFGDNTQIVVNTNDYVGIVDGEKLYSFDLFGYASGEHQVNRTACYVRFVKGGSYITLCNANGDPILKDSNGQYRVDCNNKVYYKINQSLSAEEFYQNENFGLVELQARDEKGMVQTLGASNLTLKIDRAVETIKFKDKGGYLAKTDNAPASQTFNASINEKIYFDFISDPEIALNPISTLNPKDVEIYYYKQGVVSDLLKVDDVSYVGDVLKDFIKYDNEKGKFYFQSSDAGKFEFRIGVFATYADQEIYELENQDTSPSNLYRWENMTHTKVVIDVINTNVSDIELDSMGVPLYLYSDNNVITLNGVVGEESDNKINLGFTYQPNNDETIVRYNEADFVDFNEVLQTSGNIYGDGQTVSIDSISGIVYQNNGIWEYSDFKFIADSNPINIGTDTNPMYIINTITRGTQNTQYICENGVLVMQNTGSGWAARRLPTGTYLDFYVCVEDAQQKFTKWSGYTAEYIQGTNGANKSWKVTPLQEFENVANQYLTLGVIVVNNTGVKFFEAVGSSIGVVELTTQELTFENGRNHILTIGYDNDHPYAETTPPKNIDDIVKINTNAVTYKALALITPKQLSIDDYDILVHPDYVYNIESGDYAGDYVLVGYFDGENFVNQVKAKTGATNKETVLYTVQLKGAHDKTASDIIEDMLDGNLNTVVKQSFVGVPINIAIQYDMSTLVANNLFDVDYDNTNDKGAKDGAYHSYVVGQTGVIKLSVKQKDANEQDITGEITAILSNIYTTNGNNAINLFSSSNTNFKITDVALNGNVWEISYQVVAQSNALVRLSFTYCGATFNFETIKILSNSPDRILYKYGDKDYQLNSIDENIVNTLKVIVGWGGSDYIYDWYINDTKIEGGLTLNTEKIAEGNGFTLNPDYATGALSYRINGGTGITSLDGNDIKVHGEDSCVLAVTANGVTGYINLVVEIDNKFTFAVPTTDVAEEVNNYFDITEGNGIDYSYDGTNINNKINIKNIVVKNLYGNFGFTGSAVEDSDGGKDILTIENDGGISKIQRTTEYATSQLTIDVTLETITNGEKTFTLTFSPSESVNFNINVWGDYNKSNIIYLYQNTTVQLYDTNNALFIYKGSNPEISITGVGSCGKTWTPTSTGDYVITFGSLGEDWAVKVVPNVVATVKQDITLVSETEFKFANLVDAYSYKTAGITYGSATVGAYPIITEENVAYYTSTTDYTGWTVESGKEADSIIPSNGTGNISKIEKIGDSVQETLSIKINGYPLIEDIDVLIYNKYCEIKLTDAEGLNKTNISVLEEVALPKVFVYSTDNGLIQTDANGKRITIEDTSVVFSSITSNDIRNISKNGTLFTIGEHLSDPCTTKLIFTATSGIVGEIVVTINPYLPVENNASVWSGETDVDLIKRIFGQDYHLNEQISNISIGNIDAAYFDVQVNVDNMCIVNVREIEGNSFTVVIPITITYADGNATNYETTYNLTINNRQVINVNYPYLDNFTVDNSNFVKVRSNTIISQEIDTINDNSYYEPVVTGDTIDFDDLSNGVKRIDIINKYSTGSDSIASIQVYSCEDFSNVKTYVASGKIQINNATGQVTFGNMDSFGASNVGIIKFKITSYSGSVAYYYVRVFNKAGANISNQHFSGVSASTVKELETTQTADGLNVGTNTAMFNNKTVGFDATNDINLSSYGITYAGSNFDISKIEAYLLDVESIAGVGIITEEGATKDNIKVGNADLGVKKYQKLNNITLNNVSNYYTLKVMFVYNDINSARQFPIGQLTVYVRPQSNEGTIATNENFGHKVGNYNTGEYVYKVPTNVAKFENPFGGSPELSIITHPWDTTIADVDATTVEFDKYVNTETTFVVKYDFGGYILHVHFVLQKVELNIGDQTAEEITVGDAKVTGAIFDYFENKYALANLVEDYAKEIEINSVKINLSTKQVYDTSLDPDAYTDITETGFEISENIKIVKISNVLYLEFTQTTSQQPLQTTIKYLDVEDTPTLINKFNVKAGIYVPVSEVAVDSVAIANAYNQQAGSYVSTTKQTESNYNLYQVGDLKVYTAPNLQISVNYSGSTADDGKYFVGQIYNAEEETINFVHMAKSDYIVNLNLVISAGVQEFNDVVAVKTEPEGVVTYTYIIDTNTFVWTADNLTFNEHTYEHNDSLSSDKNIAYTSGNNKIYLILNDDDEVKGIRVLPTFVEQPLLKVKLAKTYNGLKASYMTPNATKENVVSGTTYSENIYNTLFSEITLKDIKDIKGNVIYNSNRIQLLNTSNDPVISNFDFDAMGFNIENNPNAISFAKDGYIDLVDNKLTIQNVSSKAEGKLILSNITGVELVYIFNVLPQTESLVYITSDNTIHGTKQAGDNITKYVSILVNESKLEKQSIGQTYDDDIKTFAISNLRINDKIVDLTVRVETYNDIPTLYNISVDGGTINIGIDNKNEVFVSINGIDFVDYKITFDIYGDSGLIEQGYEVLVYNYIKPENLSASNVIDGGTVTAGRTPISLGDQIVYKYQDGEDKKAVDKLKYFIKSATITKSDNTTISLDLAEFENNSYYSYSDGVLITKQIPNAVTISIEFEIKNGDYVVDVIKYNLIVNRSFKVVINNGLVEGEYSSLPVDVSLVYADISDGDKFPAILDSKYVTAKEVASTYKGFSIRVFDLEFTNYTGNSGKLLTNVSLEIAKVTDLKNNTLTDTGIGVEGLNLKFSKDFSGYIYLNIKVDTGANGEYVTSLVLKVTGYQSFSYIDQTASDNKIMTNNDGGYCAGSQIDLIGAQKFTDVSYNLLLVDNRREISNTPIATTANVEYVIVDQYTNIVDAKAVFKNASDIVTAESGKSFGFSGENYTRLKTNIPLNIKQSTADNRLYSLIVYKITINYFNQPNYICYVSYKVYNGLMIECSKTAQNVDDLTDNKMPIFKLSETYIADDGTELIAIPVLDGTTWVKKINGKTFTEEKSANTHTLTYDEIEYTIETVTTNNLGNFATFNGDLDKFIMYLNDPSSKIVLEDVDGNMIGDLDEKATFDYIDMGDGEVGIDLSKPNGDEQKLFNNSLIANFKFGDSYIISNFKFTTNNAIETKVTSTEALLDIFPASKLDTNIVGKSIIGIIDNSDADEINNNLRNLIKTEGITATESVESTITIDDREYKLYKVIYSKDYANSIYNLTATCFVIGSNDGTISLIDYAGQAFGEEFIVKCNNAGVGNFDLNENIVVNYTMSADGKSIQCSNALTSAAVKVTLNGAEVTLDDSVLKYELPEGVESETKTYSVEIAKGDVTKTYTLTIVYKKAS